jgi:hypothetical protein
VLDKVPPRTAAERTRAENKQRSADRGTIFHKAVEDWSRTGTLVPPDDPEIAGWCDLLVAQWKPPKGFVAEEAWGLDPTGQYCEVEEPEPHKYVRPDGGPLLTAGRCDGWWYDDKGALWLVDWKTGAWPVEAPETNLQVNAAGMALCLMNFSKGYVPAIYYARDGVFEWGTYTAVGSPEWRQRLGEVIVAATLDDQPHPGNHCATCFSRRSCPSAQVEG